MQRDVKIGIAIGVLLIALIGIFWWAKGRNRHDVRPTGPVVDAGNTGPVEPPVQPIEQPGPTVPGAVGPSHATTVTLPGKAGPTATLPGGAPVPPVTPTTLPPPPPPPDRTHTVAAGDNLTNIAKKYGVTIAAIVAANKDKLRDEKTTLQVGWKLTIPGATGTGAGSPGPTAPAAPRTHTVAAGDTLTSIAKAHNVTIAAIVAANKDKLQSEKTTLQVGWKLTIPGN